MFLEEIIVKTKNGRQPYHAQKIIAAVQKSAERCKRSLNEDEITEVLSYVEKVLLSGEREVEVSRIHGLVESALLEIRPDVAKSYQGYRIMRKKYLRMFESLKDKVNALHFLGDKSNANADSALASTKTCIMSDYLGEMMYETSFLTEEEQQAFTDGYLYAHDKGKRYTYPFNCCLFQVGKLLQGGFEMGNIWYNEPKTLDTAFDVIGDIVLSAASQQYGGFTVPSVDLLLEPYAEKSYQKYLQRYVALGIEKARAEREAKKDVEKEFEQGFQGWEYKFNTVASSRGDYPFITMSFGTGTGTFAKMASIMMVTVRRIGQGKKGYKKPVLFPKLVFLYDEKLHGPEGELADVFEAGIQCSAKTMYPDWLSLSGKGYISDIYQKYGQIISPMGCRAFLSPWYEKGGMFPEDEEDKPVYEGRFNIGVFSLNLPMIYQKAFQEGKDFYQVLAYYLQLIRNLHKRTYDYIGEMPASVNPLAFCEGGLYGGNLKYTEKIKPLLASATASFGITALNELQILYNGKSLVEDGAFAIEVMEFINRRIHEFQEVDHHLYAVYGTPAEKLCGTQVEQFRKKYGIIECVSDRPYVSNSFHCHVTEDITPFQKQDLEERFWHLFNGGKIQYVKYPIDYNIEAIRVMVRRAMEKGFYEGVNLSLAYCDDCGHEQLEMDVCPICGSHNLTKIDRMNGYLSYSRVHGDTRLNAAKMAEIAERKSM